MVRSVNSEWIGITLDIGHAHIRQVAPLSSYPINDLLLRVSDLLLPLSVIKKNMPYETYGSLKKFVASEGELIRVVHIHDYDGKKDHLPLGKGKINFSLLSALRKAFKGPYILEIALENPYHDFEANYRQFVELMEA
jgi:sugar phosphate isomerase/epimerase